MTGAVVPNASVTAVNIATNNDFKTISGTGTGEFTLPSLAGGNYRLRVESPGFKTPLTATPRVAGPGPGVPGDPA